MNRSTRVLLITVAGAGLAFTTSPALAAPGDPDRAQPHRNVGCTDVSGNEFCYSERGVSRVDPDNGHEMQNTSARYEETAPDGTEVFETDARLHIIRSGNQSQWKQRIETESGGETCSYEFHEQVANGETRKRTESFECGPS